MGEQQPTSPQSPEEAGVQDGVRGHASINTILDQIMTITDQSLDEAQVLLFNHLHLDPNIFSVYV